MASNTLLTIGGITRRALQLFRNSNALLQVVDKQYDASFARSGAKIGSSLKVRLPNDYVVRTGATATTNGQNTVENYMTITVATQKGVDVQFGSAELALSMDDFSDRILAPMVNVLAGAVSADVWTLAESCPNLVHNVDGSNNTISPTASTWLQAGAVLDVLSCPSGNRTALLDPLTMARTVATLSGLLNPSADIGKQYKSGKMGGQALNIDDWRQDQLAIKHTVGAYSTLGTVTSVDATGTILTTSALAGPLKAGDIITVAAVNSVNRVTKSSNKTLAQWVVTADAAGSATTVRIYPAMVGPSGSTLVAYQTCDAMPTGSPAIASPTNASEVYRKNLILGHPSAMTLVTADLELPTGAVVDCAREQFDGISIRMVRDFLTATDNFLTRLDILYGIASPRPEWMVIVADSV